ncbi:rod shape-determining protein MreD [Alphaproteobacteria bacterium]|nr:rod shape-determining protein MreD [Alphaproteobacteria bacterium]
MNIYSYVVSNTYKVMPFLITVILSIVAVSPIMPSSLQEITPLLGVISLSFWILYKPELMGFIATIIIGIFNDALYGSMLGLSCLSAIMIRMMIIRLLTNIDYINIYITFLCIGFSLIIWLTVNSIINYILYPDLYNYYILVFQFLVSLAISPIIVFVQLFLIKKMSI